MLFLLILLTGVSGLQAGQNPQKTMVYTTVPEKISSPDVEADPENQIAYLIIIAEKPYFVHLHKQSFITPNAVVYTYDKHGIRQSQPLSYLRNCNYNGYVAGFPNSLVSLSICSGLRGTIQFQNVSYGIEPMEAMSGFVHMIYENTKDTEATLLGENQAYRWFSELQNHFQSTTKKPAFTKLLPRVIEMDIVVDKELFDYMGSDTKVVIQKVDQVIGLVNTMLSKLKLTVLIYSIEIWSNENRISLQDTLQKLLANFLYWKTGLRTKHVSYLLAFEEHPASIGAVYPGQLCEANYDGAVVLFPKGFSLESFSVIFTQLLSIGMGLNYDNADICHCTADVCLMTPKAIYSGGVKDFSTCSLDDLKYLSANRVLECLQELPMERKAKRRPRRICGNGIVEGKEQCDCGTLKNCTHKACCDPMSCRLKNNAICGSGECCTQDCKIKPINVLCRKPVDECDFVEYCNGDQPYCVPDTYSRNGQPCGSGEGYCYNGVCRTAEKQCMKLLGKGVRGAPFWCYEEMNSKGDRFGNCVEKFCHFQDVLCGKLVCTWPYKKLLMKANISAVYAHIRDDVCVAMYKGGRIPQQTPTTYRYMEERDETFVEDGTICGPEMYCLQTKCREIKYLTGSDRCSASRDCNQHGTCNNFEHCHCEKGYNPPFCKEMKGQFGSIDDGHQYYVSDGKSYIHPSSGILPKHQLQLIFYISLPIVFIITAVLINQKKLRQLCDREGSESNRSTLENSGTNTKLTPSEGRRTQAKWEEREQERGRERDRVSHVPRVLRVATGGYLVLRCSVLTVSSSADFETPLLLITVPQKIETTMAAEDAEKHVTKKLDFWKMMGVYLYSTSGPHQRISP
ncbi:disintegrin and metalloproteinase domain-containing protein 5-like [Acomys russatus]|uniref:disintegrin and metalloproteinase domain-containing protein 5-like n=1 Tax=Acomys russatus TaxID=60746 RepID=UPI0021E1FCD1|nr:disintegrin and metalloproteinase domain-containing protein 5-like [Acomys russatus]